MKKDYINQKFGRLTVIKEMDSKIYPGKKYKTTVRMMLCQCSCGNTTIVGTPSLTTGNTTSCGCYNKEKLKEANTTHGCSWINGPQLHRDTYHIWAGMKSRCSNPNTLKYKYYGGRGITVCDKWKDSKNGFINFINDMGYKPTDDHSIDRIDPTGNYSPDNCRWVTFDVQCKNKRNSIKIEYKEKIYSLSDLAIMFNLKPGTLYSRLYEYKWELETALTSAVDKRIKNRNKKNYDSKTNFKITS